MSPQVRPARHEDVQAVAAGVRELLIELDGTPRDVSEMQSAVRTLIEDPQAGALLVADSDGVLIGVLGASWQVAIHVPGPYALIQELWVRPSWRGQAIGASLIAAMLELARDRHVDRVEVGLPGRSFARFDATEAFYLSNGFQPNGPRMRRTLQ
jgi:GNAT superfamily N-acetyltransferase